MHDDLTVKENLNFIAALRLPAKLRNTARQAVVADVMAVLEIDRIAHSVIGNVETRGISGGQRKRVNIGMEMVADPSLLFLDEPTSGLGEKCVPTLQLAASFFYLTIRLYENTQQIHTASIRFIYVIRCSGCIEEAF